MMGSTQTARSTGAPPDTLFGDKPPKSLSAAPPFASGAGPIPLTSDALADPYVDTGGSGATWIEDIGDPLDYDPDLGVPLTDGLIDGYPPELVGAGATIS